MRSALVLNASYEPLSVVAARRAACLVLAEKADVIEEDGTELRSPSIILPSPLVIRLRYMVKVRFHRRTALSRRAVFARDGQHEWENVAAACRPCNLQKRDRTPDEAGMRLARPCRAPRSSAWVVVSVARVPEAWKPYLAIAS